PKPLVVLGDRLPCLSSTQLPIQALRRAINRAVVRREPKGRLRIPAYSLGGDLRELIRVQRGSAANTRRVVHDDSGLLRRRGNCRRVGTTSNLPAADGEKACFQLTHAAMLSMLPNTQVEPRRVVERSTWQAAPAMCFA